ncbi:MULTISPECIES: AAA family ATPase [Aliivibrio]|uniref:endopeptidase La n=1 Tax=Aliivibrio finisterrensis TaxID=511998 RepID=A0A4Q5KXL3_9GAMM|nr:MULTISPECIES: AAA family ATPase [Aliivibrio]MDD9178715.1 AAA family ATPase [Aliivibrio sp. A6]RYU52450.1 Lon protease family protein [Aliivibrio finisterrensis]RYU55154.1 Lon protease family protein [Aliivibrio finisterrensis]RYU59813.1 Lon protease family protein [Aliivibrio finisterrensis]RYU65679.1 Lon protease family protein [Aliivibrio finisterrensis]
MPLDTPFLIAPQYDHIQDSLNQSYQIDAQSPYSLQPRLTQALEIFSLINGVNILQINALDNHVYREYIANWLVLNAAHSKQDITPVIVVESCTDAELFGVYHNKSDILEPGLLQKANGGFLIISPSLLLANPYLWPRLKSLLQGQSVSISSSDSKSPTKEDHRLTSNVKLIIVGDRALLGEIEQLEPDLLAGMSMFAEYEFDTKVTSDTVTEYLQLIGFLSKQHSHLPLENGLALLPLLKAGAKECEDQTRLNLCLLWLNSALAHASLASCSKTYIDANDFKASFETKYHIESYLPSRALDDILEQNIFIETDGEKVGQINGLTVVSVPGHPISYGEPSRISCVVHVGDGELSDVERKVELGGDLHAKGMLIMQAYILSQLNTHEPLPFTASMVFEQSYCEVDGDSASLAELCAFLSALAIKPIDQSLAITGSVDQFGMVQPIGGVNEKIEAFFQLCEKRGLTGKQGVIIPETNGINLVLSDEVIRAVEEKQFTIYPISHVEQAVELLTGMPLQSEEHESIFSLIAQHIEDVEHNPSQCSALFCRFKNWFNQR